MLRNKSKLLRRIFTIYNKLLRKDLELANRFKLGKYLRNEAVDVGTYKHLFNRGDDAEMPQDDLSTLIALYIDIPTYYR